MESETSNYSQVPRFSILRSPIYTCLPLLCEYNSLAMYILSQSRSPSVSNLFPLEGIHSPWALRFQNLVLRVQIISSVDRDLGLTLTRLYKPVAFRRKAKTPQSTKAVTTNMERSIGADPILLIQRVILDILLPKFSTSCPGMSVSIIFARLGKARKHRKN